MKKPVAVFLLKNLSSSSLGRYQVELSLDKKFQEILKDRKKIINSQKFGRTQKDFLKRHIEDNFLKKVGRSVKYLDSMLRQGIRDVLIRSSLHAPPEIDEIIKEVANTNLALIPDSSIVNRAILSKHLANHLIALGSERFYIAIPRSVLCELENNASNPDSSRKRTGFRGLQEVNALKKYPSHIFTIQVTGGPSYPLERHGEPSIDALIRHQIVEYARTYSSLVKTCFLTCDKINHIIARIEGIESYNLNIGDIFSIPKEVKIPRWSPLYGRIYTPISSLLYELAICFGEIQVVDSLDTTKCDLSITLTGDFPEKKAEEWIDGTVKMKIEKGNDKSILHDMNEPSLNIQKVEKLM